MGVYITMGPSVLKAGQLKHNLTKVTGVVLGDAYRALKSGPKDTKTVFNIPASHRSV